MKKILYITYDGISEPLGQSQVLAYIEKLAHVHTIHLISFEKVGYSGDGLESQALANRIDKSGIIWHPLRYHKRPAVVATAWDIARGSAIGLWLVVRYQLSIIHARSYVPSVMAILIKKLTGARYIFDMRGFWVDERVEGGLWPRDGLMFCVAKWFERRFLLGADHVVSLTQSAICVMTGFGYLQRRMPAFTVIRTCADLQRFKPDRNRPLNGPFVMGYVGSVGTWHMFDKVVVAFKLLLRLRPDARLLVVNLGGHEYIRQCLQEAGVPDSASELTVAPHSKIPSLINRMDSGIFFYKPVLPMQATSPTKLGELLGCGVPCLCNSGVGDVAEILEADRVGVVIDSFDDASLNQGLIRLLSLCADPEVSDRCEAAALRYFSLDEGVARYERIYNFLGE